MQATVTASTGIVIPGIVIPGIVIHCRKGFDEPPPRSLPAPTRRPRSSSDGEPGLGNGLVSPLSISRLPSCARKQELAWCSARRGVGELAGLGASPGATREVRLARGAVASNCFVGIRRAAAGLAPFLDAARAVVGPLSAACGGARLLAFEFEDRWRWGRTR
jgi:hypothetical protein